jgi:outer membrane protein assembly factor BamD
MRKPTFLLTLPIAALLAAQGPARGAELPSWVPFFGEKKQTPQNTSPSAGDEAAANDELKRGEALESSGKLDEALSAYRNLVKTNGFTNAAAKAQFHSGRVLEHQGKYQDAFKAYTDYTTRYPKGGDFDTAIQSQFDIAKLYLNGRKKKILGVPIATDFSKAQEMFESIVKRAPFHKLAPLSQFNVGQALEKEGKPSEAIGAYQEVITRYAGDPVADDAQYQIGYVQYRSAQDGSYDQNARVRAREAFEDFVNRYPGSEKVPQAKQNIQSLSGSDVKGTLGIAKFYDKTKNYKAAYVYYNEVIRVAPSSPESEQSRKRIDELKGLVGADALRGGPERAQSGDMALARRRAQARVDVASRPDYNGPIVPYPYPAIANRPNMRTSPIGPIVEPATPLPAGDPLQGTPGALPPTPPGNDPLIPPALPPPPADANKPDAPADTTETPAAEKPAKSKSTKRK